LFFQEFFSVFCPFFIVGGHKGKRPQEKRAKYSLETTPEKKQRKIPKI